MYKNKTFLAIIPARGGSKRLPNKNILELKGKPLIAWSIEAAKKSKYIDNIVVSSDSDKILDIAKKYSVITIKRPDSLATDTASSIDVIKHVVENIKEKYDYIVLLQPTSPLRNEEHIDEAIEELIKKNADAIVSVCEIDHPVEWSNVLPENLSMENFISKENLKRSQDLPKRYRINGAIYICKTDKFLEEKTLLLEKNIFAYVMDKKYSVDIDDEFDFKLAEVLLGE